MRLRDWLGTAATIATALLEHWLGETAAVAALTAAVVIFGGLLWRRVSLLMAAPQTGNCTKAYELEGRLNNYIGLMKGLAPIANANSVSTTNATFLAGLSQCGPQSYSAGNDGNTGSSWATGERGYINAASTSIDGVHGALVNHGFMAGP
jgi:hypothetical protein